MIAMLLSKHYGYKMNLSPVITKSKKGVEKVEKDVL